AHGGRKARDAGRQRRRSAACRRHPRRRETLLAKQFAHELDGRRPVSTTLDQDLETLAFVVDGTPQIHVLARDPDDHFVEMPTIARSRTASPQTPSDRRSEFALS